MTRKGSVIVYVLIMIVATTAVLIATASLSVGAARVEVRKENAAIAGEVVDGAIAQFLEDQESAQVSLPSSRSITVGSYTCYLVISDNSSTLPNSLKIVGQVTVGGFQYFITRYVGNHRSPSVFYYAVASGADFLPNAIVTSGSSGVNGDIYSTGNITLANSLCQINGDMEAGGNITTLGATVTGSALAHVNTLTFPTFSRLNYILYTGFGGGSLNGATFVDIVGDYPGLIRVGNLNIKGTFTGKGTIYVTGNLTINGDMSYADSNSRLVIIVEGNVSINSNNNVVGTIYAQGTIDLRGHGTINVIRGNLVTSQRINIDGLTIAGEPAFFLSTTEAQKHHLPGFWP